MGNQLVWEDRYNIGVDVIDKEHKKLFSVLNRMLKYKNQEEKTSGPARKGLSILKIMQ